MSTYEIRVVDPADEALMRVWWEVGRAASAERPFDAWPAWEVTRRTMPQPRTDGERTLVLAFEDDVVVGSGFLWLFLLDNRHLCEIDVYVAPEHRRRGVGRALLLDLEDRARKAGRTTALSSAFAPVGAESPGSSFAAAMGYPVASAEETKLVDLTSAPAGWTALTREVEAALDGYAIEILDAGIPDDRIDDFCALLGAFLGEIPTGDLDLEQARWTPERVRENEQRAAAAGTVLVIAVAVAPGGHLCGFSDLRINRADPRHASVGGTLVMPEHRGHRLGLGMKLATHRRLLELFPGCAYVETGNAGVNAHMNAVNGRLGYRVVERCLDVQKRL